VGKNSRTKGDVLVKVAFSEPIATEFQLRRTDIRQVGVEDTQRVEVCQVMTADLVGTNE
jgi:hypothetical protein